MQITNQDQFRRTVQALAETDALIAKERSYLPKFQKADYLAFLEAHADNLGAMIRQYQA